MQSPWTSSSCSAWKSCISAGDEVYLCADITDIAEGVTAIKQEINERRKKMKDKRFLLCFSALTVLVSGMVSARGYRDMTLEYEHSMRLENKVIVISLEEIAPRLSENEELMAKGVVWIDGVERPEYARVLGAQEFDQLFSKFLDLDIKDMVNYGAGVPGDGFNVTITIKSQPITVSIKTWTPDYNPERRKLEEFYAITMDIFKLFGLEELY